MNILQKWVTRSFTVVLCLTIACVGFCVNAEGENSSSALGSVSVSFADPTALTLQNGAKQNGDAVEIPEEGSVSFTVNAAPGDYWLRLEYDPLPAGRQNVLLDVKLDGVSPSHGAGNILLRRLWRDKTDAQKEDSRGNDIRIPQEEVPFSDRGWLTETATDSTQYANSPLVFSLKETQTVELFCVQSAVRIRSLTFLPPEAPVSYRDYAEQHRNQPKGAPSSDLLEAENTVWKNDPTLLALSDRSTPATSPSKGAKISLNVIGGEKWTAVGSTLAWQVQVEKSGMYQIRLRCRQNYSQGFYATRSLKINGETPFAEAENLRFLYKRGWQQLDLSDKEGEPYLFYFEAGKPTILSLTVSLGDFAELLDRTDECVQALNGIYREMLMIMSASPDGYRDYNLDELIPDTIKEMTVQADRLDAICEEIISVSGNSGSDLEPLSKLSVQLRTFAKDTGKIASHFSLFKENIAGLNDWIADAAARPLDIDTLQLAAPGLPAGKADAGFFHRLWYAVKLFFSSFFEDYSNMDALNGETEEEITVWSVSGRDQASIYNDMIRSLYQPQSAERFGKTVGVRIQIVNADTILPSLATGKGPDVLMNAGVGQPVDFAMRGVSADLRKLVGKEELDGVLSRFRESAYVPFQYNGGLYALPEQQTYLMMFYRSDILAQLGIEPPTVENPWTWDQIETILPTLQKNNMSILMETGANANTNGLGTFAMLLYQNGGAFYTEDGKSTALDSEVAVEVFRNWTNLYNKSGYPAIFNLANRFRTGESPIAIADLTLYNTLVVSAPEIKGLWEMATVPGTRRADGTVDCSCYSSSTGVVLLEASRHKEAAWDYMKWWTDCEAQTYFGNEMESLLGASARYPTANLAAIDNLDWTSRTLRVIKAQAEWAKAVPEVPGGYYLPRYINNAFRTATRETNRLDAREAILTYSKVINNEIRQKRTEFGLDTAVS